MLLISSKILGILRKKKGPQTNNNFVYKDSELPAHCFVTEEDLRDTFYNLLIACMKKEATDA